MLDRIARIASLPLLVLPLLVVGCAGGQEDVKHAEVKAGAMPAGQEWRGVYYSKLYGYLHILDDGGAAHGAWRITAGDAYGEMHGEIEGDLFRFDWVERRIGAVGAGNERHGKGFFRYSVPHEGEAAELHGQWGLGESNSGNTWTAVKQKNMEPDPDSVKPDEIEGRVPGAGGWDDEGEGSGESESGESDESSGEGPLE